MESLFYLSSQLSNPSSRASWNFSSLSIWSKTSLASEPKKSSSFCRELAGKKNKGGKGNLVKCCEICIWQLTFEYSVCVFVLKFNQQGFDLEKSNRESGRRQLFNLGAGKVRPALSLSLLAFSLQSEKFRKWAAESEVEIERNKTFPMFERLLLQKLGNSPI